MCSQITHSPVIDKFRVIMSMLWLETLLNIRCIIILQQLMLLLMAISLFAILLPVFVCEGLMRTLRFSKAIDFSMEFSKFS